MYLTLVRPCYFTHCIDNISYYKMIFSTLSSLSQQKTTAFIPKLMIKSIEIIFVLYLEQLSQKTCFIVIECSLQTNAEQL